jgi:hypothetical protein
MSEQTPGGGRSQKKDEVESVSRRRFLRATLNTLITTTSFSR